MGGPPTYSQQCGDQSSLLAHALGQRSRSTTSVVGSWSASCWRPTTPACRTMRSSGQALRDYMVWAVSDVLVYSPVGSEVPDRAADAALVVGRAADLRGPDSERRDDMPDEVLTETQGRRAGRHDQPARRRRTPSTRRSPPEWRRRSTSSTRTTTLRVGVLTGAGGTFCAGMDLKAFLKGEAPIVEGRGLAGVTQQQPRKPLIAAVEGWALAGGFEIMLACDLAVAAETARFGVPEVKRGLVAGAGCRPAAARAGADADRARAAADRRPDRRRAGGRARAGQPA